MLFFIQLILVVVNINLSVGYLDFIFLLLYVIMKVFVFVCFYRKKFQDWFMKLEIVESFMIMVLYSFVNFFKRLDLFIVYQQRVVFFRLIGFQDEDIKYWEWRGKVWLEDKGKIYRVVLIRFLRFGRCDRFWFLQDNWGLFRISNI